MSERISSWFIRGRYLAALGAVALAAIVSTTVMVRQMRVETEAAEAAANSERLAWLVSQTIAALAVERDASGRDAVTAAATLRRMLPKLRAHQDQIRSIEGMVREASARRHAGDGEFLEVRVTDAYERFLDLAEAGVAHEDENARFAAALSHAHRDLLPAMRALGSELQQGVDERRVAAQRLTVLVLSCVGVLLIVIAARVFHPMERRIISTQDALERETERARAAEQSKGAFLANISHEIRTLLNGVTGVNELLARSRLTPEQAEYVAIMRGSGAGLLRLINDVLDFSKVAAGSMAFERRPFAVSRVLVETARLHAPRIVERGVEMVLDIDASVPDRIVGDEVRVRQIASNLLTNAAKFTDEGAITLSARWDEANETLEMAVADTGVGIAAEKLSEIFVAYQQIDNALTPKHHGTGLGLGIVRMLAEGMGGSVSVTSEAGVGSEFRVRLPAAATSFPARERRLEGVRVAIGPMQERLKRSVSASLTAAGAVVGDTADGRGHDADWLVLAIPLRDGDCSALSRWRRAHPAARVLALTPAGMEAVGVDASAPRPVDPDALVALIAGDTATEGAEPGAQSPVRVGAGLRVLVADDNAINQMIAQRFLEDLGCAVMSVDDGRAAVEATLAHKPDLVLMDVSMPVMTGIEATQQIRRAEVAVGRRTPIIALTAYALQEQRRSIIEGGMDDLLAKPFRPEDMAALVGRWGAAVARTG